MELVIVTGMSGAGKSTLQKVLTGLCTNYKGTAKILGIDSCKHGKDFYEKMQMREENLCSSKKQYARFGNSLRCDIPLLTLNEKRSRNSIRESVVSSCFNQLKKIC